MFTINARILKSKLTGVQRYLSELLYCWEGDYDIVSPKYFYDGVKGHLWEQTILPSLLNGNLLFSPSNTGPLTVKKQIVTIHDVVPIDHPEWLNPKFSKWYRFVVPKLTRSVSRIITISEFTKQRIIDLFDIDENKIALIPNGVGKHFTPQSVENIDHAVKQLNIPTAHYILSLGSIEPRKNLNRLLAAWEHIQDKIPTDIWLVIAGAEGKSIVFKESLIKIKPKRIHYTGHVPDDLLPGLYSGALAFVYLSEYEGFGLPPLEAMASGTPILTGNRTALPEVVGDAGLMVNPFDIEAISDGLMQLSEDSSLREELKQKGLQRSSLFTWHNTALLTRKVIEETN